MKKQKMLIICEKNLKKPHFDPLISALGVKINVNNVNITKTPLYFQSSHTIQAHPLPYGLMGC